MEPVAFLRNIKTPLKIVVNGLLLGPLSALGCSVAIKKRNPHLQSLSRKKIVQNKTLKWRLWYKARFRLIPTHFEVDRTLFNSVTVIDGHGFSMVC